jgi:hypothetical protein
VQIIFLEKQVEKFVIKISIFGFYEIFFRVPYQALLKVEDVLRRKLPVS